MPKFIDYASLTDAQRDEIVQSFRLRQEIGYSDPGHNAACTAASVFSLTDRQWNGKIGSNAFAATLAVLVMKKEIKISY